MKELYDENLEKVSGAISEIYQDEQTYKRGWANVAKKCVAFANGDQLGDIGSGAAIIDHQPVVSKRNSRRAIYQTNEIAPVIRTLTSYMTRSKPAAVAEVYNEREDSKHIAKIAEKIQQARYDLDEEYSHSREESFWSLVTGSTFAKNWWNYALGDYTAKVDPATGEPVLNEFGEDEIDSQKSGDSDVATLTALSLTLDHSVTSFKRQPYIIESYVMPLEWAKEAFDQDGPGYTGKAKDIREENVLADTLSTLEDMKFSIPYLGTSGKPKSKGKVLTQELYLPPNRAFPRGRMAIKSGGQIVYCSDATEGSPYFMPYDPTMWHPYSAFFYEPYIGRLLGKGLVEQIIPIQMRINEINGAILENANTLAKPNFMAIKGQLARGILNGGGANVYEWNWKPNQQAPFVIPGTPLPQQFFNELQYLRDAIVRIVGTNFVMQGQPPTGVTAASAIDQLLENANTQQSDMMNAWAMFHADRYTKKLRIIHKFNVLPGKRLNDQLSKICDGELKTTIRDFVGARDLSDGVNIKIEEGSMIPKSQKAINAAYQELAKGGVLHPALAEDSPRGDKIRTELMEKMKLEPLESEESSDYKKAKWENDRIMQGETPEISQFDNPAIHLPCHIAKAQDPKFLEDATEEQKNAIMAHIEGHQQQVAQKQAEEQAQQMPEGMPDPAMMTMNQGLSAPALQ